MHALTLKSGDQKRVKGDVRVSERCGGSACWYHC